ncbi:MAG: T9SS type A sorting domain-containing protein, partial [Bacteroidota bacterium]
PEGHSWGLWAGTTDQMLTHFFPGIATSVEAEETVPATYALSQNYPNPFNPSTQIQYELPAANHVSLRVYDILGREVAELVNGRQSAGRHTVTFDAQQTGRGGMSLSSGVYIFRLKAGDYLATRKMMLVK